MPGFFESLSRMFKGEPLFQDSDTRSQAARAQQPPSATSMPRTNRIDGKIAPLVVISRVESDIDDEYMTLSGEVANHHNEAVFVDKVLILGERRELDREMQPGDEYEFLMYKGKRPENTSQARAELHYRDKNGDYFASIHYVEFKKLQDDMFIVDDIKFLPPVKDI